MKAILVFDIPPTCEECPCCIWDNFYTPPRCWLEQKDWLNENTLEKPNWCPLKPLPKEFGIDVEDDYAKGWNDCLKEITE